jgi:hypothetical protein
MCPASGVSGVPMTPSPLPSYLRASASPSPTDLASRRSLSVWPGPDPEWRHWLEWTPYSAAGVRSSCLAYMVSHVQVTPSHHVRAVLRGRPGISSRQLDSPSFCSKFFRASSFDLRTTASLHAWVVLSSNQTIM